jgi:pimeloyl-ACP methyl ester carboxylesterase
MQRRFVSTKHEGARIEGLWITAGHRRSSAIVVETHPREWSCLGKWPGPALVPLGIDSFTFNNRFVNSMAGTELVTIFELFALDVGTAVAFARDAGYEHVVLYGWSAGGPVMAWYQALAEAGNAVARRRRDLAGFDGFAGTSGADLALPAADGMIFSACTIGIGPSFLNRLDPSVVDEDTGERDPSLDMYAETSGFDTITGAGAYDPDFLHRFRAAQAERMHRLIARAQGMSSGEDDPGVMVIRGTRADPKAVDLALASRTEGEYLCVPSGQTRVIESTRLLRPHQHLDNRRLPGIAVHLAQTFLSYRAVRPTPAYADAATGIAADAMDYHSVHSTMPGNLEWVTVPQLFIQGTSDPEPQLPSAELNYRSATASSDTQLVFVEGAEHWYLPTEPRYGDTAGVAARTMADWVHARFHSAAT